MKQRDPAHRAFHVLAAILIIVLGLLVMIHVFARSNTILIESQDEQMTKTALSVDNNIRGHLNWYCSDLSYIVSHDSFQNAESTWLATGDPEFLLDYLRSNPLIQTGNICDMLVIQGDRLLLSIDQRTDYQFLVRLGEINGVEIQLYKDDSSQIHLALCQQTKLVTYVALINGNTFFTIAETQTAAEDDDQILLLDSSGQYFFHRTKNGIQIDRVSALGAEEDTGLLHLQKGQLSSEPQAYSYPSGSEGSSSSHLVRMVCLPDSVNSNGCFTVGLAHNYDTWIQPFHQVAFQMTASSAIVITGVLILLVFLFRFREYDRQTQDELLLLREKSDAMEELNLQLQALTHHQRLETLGTLTSSIAHEFNNLLTPIMGYSILVLERIPPEDTESYDDLLNIYNASLKAKDIISRLSDLSRKNTGSNLQDLSPDALVQRALTVTAPACPKNVVVKTALECPDALLRGNETRFSQMLLNLILNAFQAMEMNGGQLTVSTCAAEGQIRFCIRDTGPGIPLEIRDRMFEPFFTTKETGKGTGLGLAIVQQIVEDYGGTIDVTSSPIEGTCFTVCFPASHSEPL